MDEKYQLIDSGLSLSERISETYWRTENIKGEELETPASYKDKLFKVRDEIKSEMDKGETAEESICNYLKKLEYVKSIPLTKTLNSNKANCVSSTSLFLILAEMADYDLFEKCNIGELFAHVLIRKGEGEFIKNIDQGRVYSDDVYKGIYNNSPQDKPKEEILSNILYTCSGFLNNCAVDFFELGDYKNAIEQFDKALEINPQNKILQKNIMQENREKAIYLLNEKNNKS